MNKRLYNREKSFLSNFSNGFHNGLHSIIPVMLLAFFILFLFNLLSPIKVHADEAIPVTNVDELLAIRDNPEGSYVLKNDIDMSGVNWVPFTFSGTLNGDGYSILNLNVAYKGDASKDTFDGNMKSYETYFGGMFDSLSGVVENLSFYGAVVDITSDMPCFAAVVTGYLDGGMITNCYIDGTVTLHAGNKMFGVGGIAGYGNGMISETEADVTLICIDTDRENKDEQFLGGAVAAGYPDIVNCTINIDGYDSDHGYVHNGGLVGMYVLYPQGASHEGAITGNTVKGKITFYEDNNDRRAYCKPFVGEVMNQVFKDEGNEEEFTRDEVKCFDIDLMPMKVSFPREEHEGDQFECDHSKMDEKIVAGDCNGYGYTLCTCKTCGYEMKKNYTLKHHVYLWNMIKEPTVEEEGIEEGVCKNCGDTVQNPIPQLTEEEYQEIMKEETGDPGEDSSEELYMPDARQSFGGLTPYVVCILILGAAAFLGVLFTLIRISRKK